MKKWKNCAAKTTKRAAPSTASRVLSRPFSFVLIALTALLVVSCRSVKTMSRESHSVESEFQADSLMMGTSETIVTPVRVPMSQVALTLKMDSLRLLPLGASYTAHRGQAMVKVFRKPPKNGEEIVIESSCDSLELVALQLSKRVEVFKNSLYRSEKKVQSLHKSAQTTSSFGSFLLAFKWLSIGILIGYVLSKIKVIISFIKRTI